MRCFFYLALLLYGFGFSFVRAGQSELEGAPEFKRDVTQSFYVPGVGTSNITYAANHIPLIFWGEPFEADIIVASDIGANISRYSKEGVLIWRVVTYPRTVRAIDIQDGYVVAFAQNDKLTIDIASGLVKKEEPGHELYLFNKKIKGIQLVGLNDAGIGTVYINGKKLPYQTQWARDAIVNRGKLYVSDTFGHRVMIFNLKNLRLLGQKNFYFPNDLLVMNGRVLVVEEHGNRVVDVESGRIEFACPLWVYMQRQKSIMKMEGLVLKYNGPNGEGRCAREFMGQNTLYSANGAVSAVNTLIVADTDNHRVIAVKDGTVVTELLNINNPVRVMLVPEKL